MSQTQVREGGVEHPEGYDRRWYILAVLCFSLLIIVMDNTILNVALPTLVRKLHASESQLQWMVDAYTLLFAGLLLTMGNLGDKFGRRGALAAGLTIFGIGSALSALAHSPAQLIGFRALTGTGAALIMPATLSILTNVFPAEERARAIGIWAGISGVAIALGPVIGGFLLVHYWWGSVFLINVPVCALALVIGRLIMPSSRDPHAQPLDPIGAGLSIVGLVSLVYGIIEAPNKGWTSGTIVGALGVAAVVLSIFIVWELHSDHPMLNVSFFRNPRFTAASMSITLVFFALFGSIFFLTQYLQFVLGYSALQAGLRLAPMALVLMAVAPLAGQLVARLGTKTLVAIGMTIGAAGLWFLAQTTPTSGYWHVLGGLAIVAAGLSLSMVPATDSIMGSLPLGKAGVGSAMNDTTREVGGALGVAILGTVLASRYSAGIGKAFVHLPPAALVAAKSSVGGAIAVGQQIGGTTGQALITTSKSTFISGMNTSLLIAAVVALGGAVVSALWLPQRPREAAGEVAEVPAAPGVPEAVPAVPEAELAVVGSAAHGIQQAVAVGQLGGHEYAPAPTEAWTPPAAPRAVPEPPTSNGSVDGALARHALVDEPSPGRHVLDGEPSPAQRPLEGEPSPDGLSDAVREVVKEAVQEALEPFFSKVADAFVLLEDRQVALQHAVDELRRRVGAVGSSGTPGGGPGTPDGANGDGAGRRIEPAGSTRHGQ